MKNFLIKYKKYIMIGLMVLFAAIFLVSAAILIDYYIRSSKQKSQYDDLANLVEQELLNIPSLDPAGGETNAEGEVLSTYVEVIHPVTGKPMQILREYAKVYQMNTDLAGWLKIDGTRINYPVMQTPEFENYYLERDFYKIYSKHGSIYANEWANLKTPSSNVTLYGHNMNDGSMLADLHKYNDPAFYGKHPYIVFNTLFEHHLYEIFAVFFTTDLEDTGFAYHRFIDGEEEDFDAFVAKCKELSLYDTNVPVTYGDKLLTLSTCDSDYEDDHGRFVVIAKRIS